MTLIAVFSDSQSTHLLADSLVTTGLKNNTVATDDEWLSTGILIDKNDQLRYKYSEGLLKIWQLQSNMAIGLAGDVSIAISVLELIAGHCRYTALTSFSQLNQLLHKQIIHSISPFNGSCVFCGFFDSDNVTTKFKISINDTTGITVVHTIDPSISYVVGTGSQDFGDIWKRIPALHNESKVYPTLTFSLIAEHLYMKQFLGEKNIITNRYTGGAICGLFIKDGKISWQPSRSIIIFANTGGTGFSANFEWLQVVYKTWYEKGNFFSSSMFEQNGNFYQRITQYSNALSETIRFSSDNLLAEMKTFNATSVCTILLPKGFRSEFPAVLRGTGSFCAFDELYENGRIAELRLNKNYFKLINDNFFVSDDHTIKIGLDRLPFLIKELTKQLDPNSRVENPREWVRRQEELAVRLMEYGGKTCNIKLLSEALFRFLDAYEVADSNDLDLFDDAKHNLNQFIEDLRVNLNKKQFLAVTHEYKHELERYGYNIA